MNSHLLPPFISYRSSGKNSKLIKYQANSSCVIMSVILMTSLFYKELILQGEIWCWSLLRLKGLNPPMKDYISRNMLLLNFWVSTTMFYHCHDDHSIIYLCTLFLSQQIQWERELLQRTIDYSNCQIDPAPFQLVERTSLLKVYPFYTIILNTFVCWGCFKLSY